MEPHGGTIQTMAFGPPTAAGDKKGCAALRSPFRWSRRMEPALGGLGHLAQHVMQDATVLVVGHLVQRIDPAEQLHFVPLAVRAMDDEREVHARAEVFEA